MNFKDYKFPLDNMGGPCDSLGFLLWRVSISWRHEQQKTLQPFRLTHKQFITLAIASCFQEKEPLTQVWLSQLTDNDPTTVSQIVRSLEKAGYLTRVIHPNDTRAKVLKVSAMGHDLATLAIHAVESSDHAFFGVIGEERSYLVALLQKLLR